MTEKEIKTGSDFCGVGAFDQALERLGIKQNKLFACDWDKFARETYILNYGVPKDFPKDVHDRQIPSDSLDIYMTSPPCQSFSMAGVRKGEDDDRGVLFYNSHNFIKVNKPRFFIFENVKGLLSDDNGRTFQKWLDYLGGKSINGNAMLFPHDESVPYHVYWSVLNAKNYGIPQNRERVFIIGIRDDKDNVFEFPKPETLTKTLKDCLEENVSEKYYLSQTAIEGYLVSDEKHTSFGGNFEPFEDLNVVAKTITEKSGGRKTDNFIKEKRNDLILVGSLSGGKWEKKQDHARRVYSEEGISPTITTMGGQFRAKNRN